MSFVLTAPEAVTDAAGNLAGIGTTLERAAAAAAGPTTGIAAPAADEVSVAISRVFGTYGQQFQALSARAAAFHDGFVGLLNGSAAAYVGTEAANTEQALMAAVEAPAAALPVGAYGQLVANTTANLQSLYRAWAADPLPLLRQIVANQQVYARQFVAALAGAIANLPAELANLPAAVQSGVQGLLTFDAAYYVQQFVATQVGFAQTFASSLNDALTGIVAGLPGLQSGLQAAYQAVLAGNYYGAVQDVAQAFANLLVTGFNPGTVTTSLLTPLTNPTVVATVNPTILGPLGDLFTIANLPGQEAQYLTNLIPPSVFRQMAQNLTNVLDALSIPSISATVTLPLLAPTTGSLSAFFGLPLVLTYAVMGAPISALNGLATSATAVQQALLAGNGVGALGALFDAPAAIANGFLNSDTLVDFTIPVPVTLPAPFPSFNVPITLHLPFDGILVPPHPITATIDPSALGFGPTPVTIFGTPFMGLVPLLVNYLPEQLAAVIVPAA
ncbi:PE family protein [Mycobacterium parmense]|uniref:PE family protein n=1 Tax=Mycobacterium parmense TaxID=185642 RepID=A0A7I7YY14_9MYCO|nr:PE family protein [Mycobacterium parmense]MCV7352796.1 PE family protein [Mycobacterium parmense]ORW52766.1 hypothetical protein AWC20_20835 [Mycobacterium parmense]BBZ46805.1 PE family protein [Mycobacterium parmense]